MTRALLLVVAFLPACSAVQFQPAYSNCGGADDPSCDVTRERAEVLYAAECEGQCRARFALPMANLGSEVFSGEFRRRVTFSAASDRSVHIEIRPAEEEDTVREAAIRIDGEARSWLEEDEVEPGKTVRLSTILGMGG